MTLPKKSAKSLDLGRFGNSICNDVLFLIGFKKKFPKNPSFHIAEVCPN